MWQVVREAKGAPLLQGATIPHGAVIRLQHMQTRRWLHSHLHQSPITGNLEVSCFGAEGESDDGDLWILEIDGKDGVWTRDQRVRFQHIDTGAYLHSHDKKYARIAGGQQEVLSLILIIVYCFQAFSILLKIVSKFFKLILS
ncbi:hypothetical protein L7F22_008879 [Adiantum nelumboides]|nr:hypothetical protein [Adiantum nelumboides]